MDQETSSKEPFIKEEELAADLGDNVANNAQAAGKPNAYAVAYAAAKEAGEADAYAAILRDSKYT